MDDGLIPLLHAAYKQRFTEKRAADWNRTIYSSISPERLLAGWKRKNQIFFQSASEIPHRRSSYCVKEALRSQFRPGIDIGSSWSGVDKSNGQNSHLTDQLKIRLGANYQSYCNLSKHHWKVWSLTTVMSINFPLMIGKSFLKWNVNKRWSLFLQYCYLFFSFEDCFC